MIKPEISNEIRILDNGVSSLQTSIDSAPILDHLDLAALEHLPNLQDIIPSLPPQSLYYALKARGLKNCSRILRYLSDDQFCRMFDYDVWAKDKLSMRQAMPWLQALTENGEAVVYERFSGLDEEYQVAILQGNVEVILPEDMEDTQLPQDAGFQTLPDGACSYRITAKDPEINAVLEKLVASIAKVNIRYAHILLGNAAFLPPNECEHQLEQFRTARLEEDGFVTYNESMSCFQTIDYQQLQQKYQQSPLTQRETESTELVPENTSGRFLNRLLEEAQRVGWSLEDQYRIHQGLLYMANALSAATHTQPADKINLLKIMTQVNSTVSLGIEYLAKGSVDTGLQILRQEPIKSVYRVGYTLMDTARRAYTKPLERLLGQRAAAFLKAAGQQRFGAALAAIENDLQALIGQEFVGLLQASFNRFPFGRKVNDDSSETQDFNIDSLEHARALVAELSGLLAHLQLWQQQECDTQPDAATLRPTSTRLSYVFATMVTNQALGQRCSTQPVATEQLWAVLNPQDPQQLTQRWETAIDQTASQLASEALRWWVTPEIFPPVTEPVMVSTVRRQLFTLTADAFSALQSGNCDHINVR